MAYKFNKLIKTPTLQDKTVTPTKSSQTVTADEGFYLGSVAVNPIPAEYIIPTGELSITKNGSHSVSGYATVNVAVASETIQTQTKTVTPTRSSQTVTPDIGYYLSSVTVNAIPSSYIIPSGTYNITANGTYNVTSYASVTVNIPTQTKSVAPTKSAQTVTPDSGYYLSSVSVGAIPDNYIDTSSATATAADILSGMTAYVNGVKITGTYEAPSVSFNELNGELTITT